MPHGAVGLHRVFEPIDIAGVEIPNRVVRTGHVTGLGDGGGVTEDLIAYHEARARGGCGLLFLEHSSLHRTSPSPTLVWSDDRLIPGYRRITNAVHRHGARMFQQILHRGPQCVLADGSPPLAASAVPIPGDARTPRPATRDELAEIVAAHVAVAVRARDGGLDGVEVLAGHGYLIHTFLSPHFNRRGDAYGGSPEKRARLLTEVLTELRAALGSFPIGVRLSVTEHIAGGLGPTEVLSLAQSLEEASLVDFVNLSVGGYATPEAMSSMIGPMFEPHGYQLELTEPVAAGLSKPTIVTGRITTLEQAETVLARGCADLVSMVRATIADPELVNKSRSGRPGEVRPCIACNQGCLGGIWGPTRRLGCVANPTVGYESRWGFEVGGPFAALQVMVVGGGPAGMEAARTAAERGHQVTLVERQPRLGGQLVEAMNAPYRDEFGTLVAWWERELDRLGVKVLLATTADEEFIAASGAQEVIVATGAASPAHRGIAQLGAPEGSARRRVAIVDLVGGYEAIGLAEAAADQGWDVSFITEDSLPCSRLEKTMIPEVTVHRLQAKGVLFLTGVRLEAVGARAVTIAPDVDRPRLQLEVEQAIRIEQRPPADGLKDILTDLGVAFQVAGVAAGPGDLQAAVWAGRRAGSRVGTGFGQVETAGC